MAVTAASTHQHWCPVGDLSHYFLDTIRHISTALKDIIAQTSSLAGSRMPIHSTRRAACTHLVMSRLYGPHKCSHCYRTSRLGWVYSCIQDHVSNDPKADEDIDTLMRAVALDHQPTNPQAGDPHIDQHAMGLPSVTLSSWMEQAILEGHYTAEQITVLRAQRQKVKDCITVAQNEYMHKEKLKLEASDRRLATAADNSNFPSPIIRGISNGDTFQQSLPSAMNSERALPLSRLKIVPDCDYKTCQACRPISRDRSWQCVNHVLESPLPDSPPDFALSNRPISDSNLVRRLGLWKPRPRPHTFESFDNTILTDDDQSQTDISHQSSHINRESRDPSATGFRASARRAYKDVMLRSRNGSTHSRDSNESDTSTLSLAERRLKRREALGQWNGRKYDRGLGYKGNRSSRYAFGSRLWRKEAQPESSVLRHPKSEADIQADSEVKVEDGIAVTEEGVDLRTADIIMQV